MSVAAPAVVTAPSSRREPRLAAVRTWLWIVAALVFLMAVVGGATRLTESGLSITEWNLVTGVVPPLSEAAWQAEFARYQQIPQYSQLFPTMTLGDFKFIYGWEWSHRLLGRLIGVVMAVPLVWFWLRGDLTRRLKWQLTGVLALGGVQGAVGWWMVKSGLVGRVEVAPERLAIHLLLASLTFAALTWIATGLRPAKPENATRKLRWQAGALLALTLVQITLGGLVAGARAGLTYNTWPLMDGRFIPPTEHLTSLSPFWRNFLENVVTIQFEHRMTAYALLALALWHCVAALRTGEAPSTRRRAVTLMGLVVCQAALGIATLLLVLPEGRIPLGPALAHQAFAMFVLAMASVHAKRLLA